MTDRLYNPVFVEMFAGEDSPARRIFLSVIRKAWPYVHCSRVGQLYPDHPHMSCVDDKFSACKQNFIEHWKEPKNWPDPKICTWFESLQAIEFAFHGFVSHKYFHNGEPNWNELNHFCGSVSPGNRARSQAGVMIHAMSPEIETVDHREAAVGTDAIINDYLKLLNDTVLEAMAKDGLEKQVEAMRHQIFGNLSHAEIASLMGESINNVYTLLFRGRKELIGRRPELAPNRARGRRGDKSTAADEISDIDESS